MAAVVLAMAMTSLPSPAVSQTSTPPTHTVDVWTSGTLGAGTVGSDAGIAGQLALATAVDQLVVTVRGAGAATIFDGAADRGYGDGAVLVGMRTATPRTPGHGQFGGTAASISLGLARLYYSAQPTVSSREVDRVGPAVAFNAEAMAHLRFVGIGLSVFGAVGAKDRYVATGLTVGLGKIH